MIYRIIYYVKYWFWNFVEHPSKLELRRSSNYWYPYTPFFNTLFYILFLCSFYKHFLCLFLQLFFNFSPIFLKIFYNFYIFSQLSKIILNFLNASKLLPIFLYFNKFLKIFKNVLNVLENFQRWERLSDNDHRIISYGNYWFWNFPEHPSNYWYPYAPFFNRFFYILLLCPFLQTLFVLFSIVGFQK